MLPRGDHVYENLNSEFIDADDFLEELRDDEVTGYIRFENSEREGFCVLKNGEPGRVKLMENGDESLAGDGTLRDILGGDGHAVDVVECTESGCEIVEIKLRNESIKKDVSTGETEVADFLATNITDQETDCHVVMVDGDRKGVVTMESGVPIHAKFSVSDERLVGKAALERLLNVFESEDVVLDIHGTSSPGSAADTEPETRDGFDELDGMSESFDEKADELLDDMGLGFMGEEGEHIEDEFESIEEGFEDEAEDLLDEMGIETDE